MAYSQLRGDAEPGENSTVVKQRVESARALQLERSGKSNAQLDNREVEEFCQLDEAQHRWLSMALEKFNLSARAIHRTLKVARTIADMEQCASIKPDHLKESLGYRAGFLSNRL